MNKIKCELCSRVLCKCDCGNYISLMDVTYFLEWIWRLKPRGD